MVVAAAAAATAVAADLAVKPAGRDLVVDMQRVGAPRAPEDADLRAAGRCDLRNFRHRVGAGPPVSGGGMGGQLGDVLLLLLLPSQVACAGLGTAYCVLDRAHCAPRVGDVHEERSATQRAWTNCQFNPSVPSIA